MPVPGSINDLSTTEASNSPPGGEATFPMLSKYLRTHASFIAALRELVAGKLDTSVTTAFTRTFLTATDQAAAQSTLGIQSRYSPGEYVLCASTTAPTGTLATNGGTIGNASSGGTSRANADTLALFTILWNSTSNTDLVIQTSAGANTTRGASAAADFAANKRMPLPNFQDGDALVAAVSSAVASRAAGAVKDHTHSLTMDAVADHTHTQQVYSGANINTGATANFYGLSSNNATSGASAQSTLAAGGHTPTGTIGTSVGGAKNLAAGLYTRVYIAL